MAIVVESSQNLAFFPPLSIFLKTLHSTSKSWCFSIHTHSSLITLRCTRRWNVKQASHQLKSPYSVTPTCVCICLHSADSLMCGEQTTVCRVTLSCKRTQRSATGLRREEAASGGCVACMCASHVHACQPVVCGDEKKINKIK